MYEQGIKTRGRYATMFLLKTDRATTRLGIAATKKLGGAVVRNRAKRLIREAFRQNKLASGFDVVVVPRRELLDATPKAFETEYRQNIERRRQR